VIARIIYKPFSIVLGWIAARIAGKAFQSTWEHRHGTKAPSPTTEDATWGQVVGSAALRAATFAATVAVLDRLGARAFRRLTGFWPGDKQPEPAARLEATRNRGCS